MQTHFVSKLDSLKVGDTGALERRAPFGRLPNFFLVAQHSLIFTKVNMTSEPVKRAPISQYTFPCVCNIQASPTRISSNLLHRNTKGHFHVLDKMTYGIIYTSAVLRFERFDIPFVDGARVNGEGSSWGAIISPRQLRTGVQYITGALKSS